MKTFVVTKFIDSVFIALKHKFMLENSSRLKQAGIIFLLSKIYFTDNIAINLKLRTTFEEWEFFKSFLTEIKEDPQYEDICLMFYHLYTESFFRFTIKSKKLALDYGSPSNAAENVIDFSKSAAFWKEIQDDLSRMQHTDVVELKQLAEIRDKALEPFEELLPEKVSINEALESFESIKEAVKILSSANPKKTSRREMKQTCKDYLNQSIQEKSLASESDLDYESVSNEVSKMTKKKRNKNLKKQTQTKKSKQKPKKSQVQLQEEEEAESGASADEFRQMTRKIGYTSQKVLQGIGAFGSCSEKLKLCYE